MNVSNSFVQMDIFHAGISLYGHWEPFLSLFFDFCLVCGVCKGCCFPHSSAAVSFFSCLHRLMGCNYFRNVHFNRVVIPTQCMFIWKHLNIRA